jgi:hypothetical protein
MIVTPLLIGESIRHFIHQCFAQSGAIIARESPRVRIDFASEHNETIFDMVTLHNMSIIVFHSHISHKETALAGETSAVTIKEIQVKLPSLIDKQR